MKLVIRKGEQGWGFVEKYSYYCAAGRIRVDTIVGISPNGTIVEPYVFRGKDFIPAKEIDKEMGIEKYTKAKKPFYSLLNDGFIASIKASFDAETGEFIPEKSNFDIYIADGWTLNTAIEGELNLKRILEVPDSIKELMTKIQSEIITSRGDREIFLRSRFSKDDK